MQRLFPRLNLVVIQGAWESRMFHLGWCPRTASTFLFLPTMREVRPSVQGFNKSLTTLAPPENLRGDSHYITGFALAGFSMCDPFYHGEDDLTGAMML